MIKRQASATQYPKGQSGNPGGRPRGTRGELIAEFLKALLEDFKENGKTAIRTARDRSPMQYLRMIAALMPKIWLGDDEEAPAVAVPVMVYAPKHERVLPTHRLR